MTPAEQLTAAAEKLRRDALAAMHPGVGAALADWLDEVAERLAVTTHPDWQDTVEPHALAVARHILGTGSTG